jgi:hypothetical protein
MKVLIATTAGQGPRADDYCWTSEGELVRLVDCPDEYCRCSAFGGIESHRAGTTAQVVDRADLDPSTLLQHFRRDLENQGYAEYLSDQELDEDLVAEVAHLVAMLRDIAVGEIVERWGPGIRVRRLRAA